MEQNGQASSSKRTRHINIRYYFVTDRANCGEITIKHCPTVEMIGDFFTKPLQGGLFIKFRDLILNTQTDPSTVPLEDHRSVLGQDHSHATGQSQRESHATGQYVQTKDMEMPDTQARDTQQGNLNDHAVMVPMIQPTGGWHVTSVTSRSRPTRPQQMTHDQRNQNIG